MRALTWLAALVFFLSVSATTLLLVDPQTASRLVENWPPLPNRAEKVVSLVKTNWLFYGTLALFSGFAWVGLVRARRPGRFRRRAPSAVRAPQRSELEEPSAMNAGSGGRPSVVEDLLGQFEINWKSFASYTQDVISRKLQELDGSQKSVKDVSDKVSVLGRALEEIRKDLSEVRAEVRGVSQGVTKTVEKVVDRASAPAAGTGEIERLQGELRAALERLSGLDERGLKLVKVIEDERQNVVAKLLSEESRKLEERWHDRLAALSAQAEEARRESGSFRGELAKERESLALLRRELEQAAERERNVARDLDAAARDRARRVEEAKEAALKLERARKEIENRDREFSEERRRLCGKVEELEAQGTILESEKSDAESNVERLQSILDAEGAEREKLRVAAESARLAKERAEAEARRLAEELRALRGERAQARAKEVVSLEDELARLGRELQAARAEGGAEIAALRREIEARDAEIQRLKEAAGAAGVAASFASDAALQAYRAEIERLELARFDEARRSQSLEEEARKFKARLAEVEKASRERTDGTATVPGQPGRLKELEEERVGLLSSLDKLGGELEKLRDDVEGFRRFQGTLIDGSIPSAISGVDTALKVFAWNPAAESLWKVEADAVLGRKLPELSLPGLGPEILSEVERAMREKQTIVSPRSTFIDASGKVCHVEWSFDPILGPGDEPLGAVLIANEVTEKVEREIEARVQALFSQSLLRSLPSALIVLDVERRVISWNRGAERLLGMQENEVVGKDFFSLQVPLAKPAFQKRFEEAGRDGGVHRLRVRFDHEGVPGNFVVTQAPFIGNDESVRGSMLIIESVAVPVAAK